MFAEIQSNRIRQAIFQLFQNDQVTKLISHINTQTRTPTIKVTNEFMHKLNLILITNYTVMKAFTLA